MDTKLRARLDEELPGIYPRLLAKAELLVRRSGWRRRLDMDRKGVAEDLLHEAVFRAVTGTRCWNPAKVDLWGFLVGAMRSIVNEAARNSENRTDSLDESLPKGVGTKGDVLAADSLTTEEELVNAADAKEREAAIFAAAGDDVLLLKYVEAIMDGCVSPADIAKQMGVTPEVVYQTHRKLRRRIEAQKDKESTT